MEEDCSTRRDRRQRKPVFQTRSEFNLCIAAALVVVERSCRWDSVELNATRSANWAKYAGQRRWRASELRLWRWCGPWPATVVLSELLVMLDRRSRPSTRRAAAFCARWSGSIVSTPGGRRGWRCSSPSGIRRVMSRAVSWLLCWHGGESGAVSECGRSKHWQSCWRGASWIARCPGRHRGPGRQPHSITDPHSDILELIESAGQVDAWTNRDCNPGIPTNFANPEVPGLSTRNPGIFGLKNFPDKCSLLIYYVTK